VDDGEHLSEDPLLYIYPYTSAGVVEPSEDSVDFTITSEMEWENVEPGVFDKAPDIPDRCSHPDL